MSTPRELLSDARLYLCTDARRRQGDLPEFLDAVLAAGVDIVQLRDKGMEAAEELEHLAVLADACKRHGKLLAVNDRADVAHAIASDVLHLGQGDLPVPAARAVIGPDVVVGRSTHARSEVDAAVAEPGVDYFCTGPCWPTPTKPGRYAPVWTSSGTPPRWPPRARGSPSAGSTPATSTRYWTPERAGSSSCARSPRRPIRVEPPPSWHEGSGSAPARDAEGPQSPAAPAPGTGVFGTGVSEAWTK